MKTKTKDKLKLIAPSIEMKNRVMDFRGEFFANGEKKIYGSCGLHHYDRFEDWLTAVKRPFSESPDSQPPDRQSPDRQSPNIQLPATAYFAIRLPDDVIVGVVNIRHYLDSAHYHNGHIGYSVRPSERRKRYGTEILRLALIKAEQWGILEPVVTCNRQNKASKKVIERNGLTFEQEFLEDNGNTVLIYRKG